MKRILTLLIALILLTAAIASLSACSGGVSRDEAKELTDAYFTAMAAEQYEEAAALFHPAASMTAELMESTAETLRAEFGASFTEGVTATKYPHTALAVYGGGIVTFDIRVPREFDKSDAVKLEGITLMGKPVVVGDLLVVSDRLEGDVVLADISDLAAPRVLGHLHFSGHPDLACVRENSVYIPLGRQGIAQILL